MSGNDGGARELAACIARNPEGGTWHVGREEMATLSHGFVVGGVIPSRTVLPGDPTCEHCVAAERQAVAGILADAAEVGADHVGWWTDDRTGILWLDVVEVFVSRGVALQVAAERGELAVWDAAQGAEVRVTA